jgi:hypothetical protein
MLSMKFVLRASLAAALLLAGTVVPADAQRTYPSFQPSRVADREYNFALVSATRSTSVIFQWREATTARTQLSFDGGFADFEVGNVALLLGGQYARTVARATPDMPLDLLFTAGVFTMLGNDQVRIGVPAGLSVGHRFLIDGTAMAITPYVHPRISLEMCSGDPCINDRLDLAISFDLGGSLELTRQLGFRLSAKLGGAEALGFSGVWTPGAR